MFFAYVRFLLVFARVRYVQRIRLCKFECTTSAIKAYAVIATTNMDPLHDASIFNNLGVALLESKDTLHAIHSFQRAINILKEFTEELASQDESGATADTESAEIESFCMLQTGMKLKSLNQGIYYTYNRPLLLPTNTVLPSPEALNAYMVTSGVILIFNFGMACHQFGKETGQEAALHQAIQIYELTLRMISRSSTIDCIGKVVMCLALNNLANLHSDRCDYKNCDCCLECVKEILYHDICIDLFVSDFLDEWEWSELKMNLLYGRTLSAASAA
jgi:tetratricopeptide (TPR) repeat protein